MVNRFPDNLYVRFKEVGAEVLMEIYERVEEQEKDLVHMKKVGRVWVDRGEDIFLSKIEEKLKDRTKWVTR